MRTGAAATLSFENWGDLAAFVNALPGARKPEPAALSTDAGFTLSVGGTTHRVINADVFEGLAQLPDESVHCVVTSPPYWGLRDYGTGSRQIGQEATLQEHIDVLVRAFREVRRVLRKDGTAWLNYGDAYAAGGRGPGADGAKQGTNLGALLPPKKTAQGFKPKDLMLMPARLAIALQADEWYARSEIIWHKPNPMPESVRDRPTSAHEKLFLLTKSDRYFYDADAVKENALSQRVGKALGTRGAQGYNAAVGAVAQAQRDNSGGFPRPDMQSRNLRNVWTVATQSYKGAHFATFPPKLVDPCVKAGCPQGGVVLDIFAGSGTVAMVAGQLGRNSISIEINPEYCGLIRSRLERK